MQSFNELIQLANQNLLAKNLNEIYQTRLNFEISEINKQGAESYWIGLYNKQKKFNNNPNGLLLPWLLELIDQDPIATRTTPLLCSTKATEVKAFKLEHGEIPKDIIKDADMPDIDLDCLPEARDHIKKYAIEKYGKHFDDGYGSVCSVGTWQTYKFKSAIIDVAVALGVVKDRYEIEQSTTELPIDVDELKVGGKAKCTGKIKNQTSDEEKECGTVHDSIRCPKCGAEETDGPTLGKLILENPVLNQLYNKHKQVIESAVQIIGCVRNMGMHAGALIIADRTLYGNIPLARNSQSGQWISMWSEGRNTQLSKFGYTKWDILGLKTLEHVTTCCKLIYDNRGISFGNNMSGWEDINPHERKRGHFFDSKNNKKIINLDDSHALKLANEQKVSTIFQFDTDLAKSTLANGVKTFEDLMLLSALGHPGPLKSIPDVIKNRDDKKGLWKQRLKDIHPILFEILEETYGYFCYQEQLAAAWQRLAGFTAVEAQEARKAVAKKWVEKLKAIKNKWMEGSKSTLSQENAEILWSSMESFGRYAFNRSHSVSYSLVTIQSLWLKAHFAPEWWAAVMSNCHPDKLVRFMGTARSEKWDSTNITYCGHFKPKDKAAEVKFTTINIDNLTTNFTVSGDMINQGLIGIKNIGESASDTFAGKRHYDSIEEFLNGPTGNGLDEGRKNKIVLERFIKLGAFKHLKGHENSKALWNWYLYKHCSGKDVTELKRTTKQALLDKANWNVQTIAEERSRQLTAYQSLYPNRKKIPPKIAKWLPKPEDTRENIMALYDDDYTIAERLLFQKQFLGYYLDSPLDLYYTDGGNSIEDAKKKNKNGEEEIKLEVIIIKIIDGVTKKGSPYLKLIVDDGLQHALILMWSNELAHQDLLSIQEGVGISVVVDYDQSRNSFSVSRGESIIKLKAKE